MSLYFDKLISMYGYNVVNLLISLCYGPGVQEKPNKPAISLLQYRP